MDKFEWTCYNAAPLSEGYSYLDTEFEAGNYQRQYRYGGGRKPREWELSVRGTLATILEIREFWHDHNRSANWKFLWDDPLTGERDIVVCFAGDVRWNPLQGKRAAEVVVKVREVL